MIKSKNKSFFTKKICCGCKRTASIFTCTQNGNKVYCAECHKKFINQKFNKTPFKSLDVVAKEQCQINIEKNYV